MNEILNLSACHQTYIPFAESPLLEKGGLFRKLLVATTKTPDQVCGTAWRVGRVDRYQEEIAIYRLKIKAQLSNRLTTITLPGFFVLEQGEFIPWEHWRDARGGGQSESYQ
jgi:hypothetical protein